MGVLSTAVLLGLLAACNPAASLAQNCSPALGAGINASGPYGLFPNYIHIGETATISQLSVANPASGGGVTFCTITNLKSWIIYPNNSFQTVLNLNPTLFPSGSSIVCPGGGSCLAFTATYVVQAPNVGAGLSFSTNWPPSLGSFTSTANGIPNTVLFQYASAGSAVEDATARASASPSKGLIVLQPCVNITKNCITNCTTYGQPIGFSGVIANCSVLQSNASDGTLLIASVTDNPPATINLAATTSTGRAYDGTLLQGESITYSGSYTPGGNGCGPYSDTITVIAADLTGYRVTNSATATCHVRTTPGILLSKDCHVRGGTNKVLQVGDFYVDDFVVQNTGNVPLTNVVIRNIDPLVGPVDLVVGNLAIAQSVTVHYTNGPVTTNQLCQTLTDSATVTANSLCPLDATCPSATRVTNGPVTCSLTVPCEPRICVSKLIACAPASGIAGCLPGLDYQESAKGVAGTNNPAFCYQIIVSNCGQVALTNVTLTDAVLTGNGVNLGNPVAALLNPGQSVTNYYGASWGVGTHTNIVTASGQSAQSGETVTAQDDAVAVVVSASVNCDITLYSSVDMDSSTNDNHVTLPTGSTNTPVQFSMNVCNPSQADLSVSLNGLPPLVDCGDVATLISVPATTNIPAGQCITIAGCVVVADCTGLQIQVTVQGTVLANTNFPCIYDTFGNVIRTAASSCSAVVTCSNAVTCRVTGGGTLYEGDISTNCINTVTMLYSSMADAEGLVVDHISHGGQLGAPFSQMDCGERLANPCIRGEWQHVRHYDNKQNGSKGVFDMSFHSANPNVTGHFDSLECACLPCCYNGTNYVGNQPAPPGWDNFKFQVCNKDDRKICGPLPRPAPANAIIFSGIGTFTPATNNVKGRAAASRYVVFRVYIEDRSEPGGIHPGGAKMPGTIYCFQAWDTGLATKKKQDFSSLGGEVDALRIAVAQDGCAFLAAMSNGQLPQGSLPLSTVLIDPNDQGSGVAADVVDCGPLRNGSQQIHPSTSATCKQ